MIVLRKKYIVIISLLLISMGIFYHLKSLQKSHTISGVEITHFAAKPLPASNENIRIMTFNIAMESRHFYIEWLKYWGFPSFIKYHMDSIAKIINRNQPDIVILNEAVQDILPFEKDLVSYLAEKTQFHQWAFKMNHDRFLGIIRSIGGNAILSRYPLQIKTMSNELLFPWMSLKLATQENIWIAAVHNDHKSWKVNLEQTKTILTALNGQPTILAGDFNVPPESQSMQLIENIKQFSGEFHGQATSPHFDNPSIPIDFVFAPSSWELLEHRVIPNTASDHKAVISTFRIHSRL
jgi:endonuclease/exonuclease/phosphatase family metal-dependent hydrolase